VSRPEGRGIFPNLTVVENLRMATFAGAQFKNLLDRAFTDFRGSRAAQQLAGTLSGGEQQMLSMARADVDRPEGAPARRAVDGLAPLVVENALRVVAHDRR